MEIDFTSSGHIVGIDLGTTNSLVAFMDLTGPSFAALRLPAILAAVTLLVGPTLAWRMRVRRQHLSATFTTAMTAAMFLVAAHIAFVRFQPMLSSRAMANTINAIALSFFTAINRTDRQSSSIRSGAPTW